MQHDQRRRVAQGKRFRLKFGQNGRVQTSSPQSRARRDGWRPAGRSPGSALSARYRASAATGRSRRDYPLPSPRRNARPDRRDAGNRRSGRNRPRRSPASNPVIFTRGSRMILRASRHALGKRRQALARFERIAGRNITQMLCSPSRRKAMAQTRAWPACGGLNDPPNRPMRMPRAKRRQIHARVCPAPCTTYLNDVSCATPTGPRACIRPVAMPISAPKPNSPPSANCVEAL